MTTPRSAHPRQQVILALLKAHRVPLTGVQIANLLDVHIDTMANVLRTLVAAGAITQRRETKEECTRRRAYTMRQRQFQSKVPVLVYEYVEPVAVATFTPRHDLAGLGVLEKMRARQSQEQEL